MTELLIPADKMKKTSMSGFIVPSVALVFALGCLYYRTTSQHRNIFVQFSEYLFIVLASTAAIGFLPAVWNRFDLKRIFAARYMAYLSAAILFCLVLRFGTYQFGGADEGTIVHAAAYYQQGLRPMIDFPSSVPPLFLAGIRLALITLGMRWASFAALIALFAAVTLIWSFALLRIALVPAHWALIIALIIEAATTFLAPFWWYNNVTIMATVLLLLSAVACLRNSSASSAWVSLAVSLAMVITGKPNSAPACLMVIAVFATRDRSRWIKGALACGGAAVLATLVCAFAQTPPGLLLTSYSEVARLRANPLLAYPWWLMGEIERLFELIWVLTVTLCAVDLLIRTAIRRTQSWQIVFVCGVAMVSSALFVLTNAEINVTSMIGMFTGCAILCLTLSEIDDGRVQAPAVLVYLTVIFAVTSGLFGFTHLRIRGIGEAMYFEPYETKMIQNGFFVGLEASPRLQDVLAQTQDALQRFPSHTVFFGPRMEFEYAVFNRTVMRGMPLFWDSEGLFSPQRFPQVIKDIREQDPDILIFLKDDYTRMGTVADYIKSVPIYQRLDYYEDITVYVRKRNMH